MTRFYGVVGYSEESVETPADSGVYVDKIVERPYYGDVTRNTRQVRQADKINDDLTVNNLISIVADQYAYQNILAIRYVKWLEQLWVVTDVDVNAPRLILSLGGVYNGPTPS